MSMHLQVLFYAIEYFAFTSPHPRRFSAIPAASTSTLSTSAHFESLVGSNISIESRWERAEKRKRRSAVEEGGR